MASLLLDDDFPKIEVDVDKTRTYLEGFTGHAFRKVNIGKKGYAQAFELRFHVSDPNDLIAASSKYSARLSHDGMSIRVTIPALPSYVYLDSENMLAEEAVTAVDAKIHCANAHEEVTAFSLKVQKNPNLQTRSFDIQLSKKCRILDDNYGVLGGQSLMQGHELTAHYFMFNTTFAGRKWPVFYFYWRVQVDNIYENLAAASNKIKAEELFKKMLRMSLLDEDEENTPKRKADAIRVERESRWKQVIDSTSQQVNF